MKVVEESEAADCNRIAYINFILDIVGGKVELLGHLVQAEEQDNSMDQELYQIMQYLVKKALQKHLTPIGKAVSIMSRLNGKLVKSHLYH